MREDRAWPGWYFYRDPAEFRAARRAARLTQAQLRAAAGLGASAVSSWERGASVPQFEALKRAHAAIVEATSRRRTAGPRRGRDGRRVGWMAAVLGSGLRPDERLVLLAMATWMDSKTGQIPADRLPTAADIATAAGKWAPYHLHALTALLGGLVGEGWLVRVDGDPTRYQIAPQQP